MSFVSNRYQQVGFDNMYIQISDRTKKYIQNTWAGAFAERVFPYINEERFAVLYSDNPCSRPNTPVNFIIGALLLKEMMGLTDDELMGNIMTDVKYQYALHTTGYKEQPISDRTFSRFREKLYRYEQETGQDLIKEEIMALSDKMIAFMKISPNVKRMDSVMIASNCKKMSRLEIVYTCISNLTHLMQKEGKEGLLTERLALYLKDEHKNQTLYYSKTGDLELNLTKALEDAQALAQVSADLYQDREAYQLLLRVLQEQAQYDEDGRIKPKSKKTITSDSLQNPSDPDATFRKKAGEIHKGYVGNFVETVDENGGIISQFDYKDNTYSDSAFCKDVMKEIGKQEEKVTLIADGAYGGEKNQKIAEELNIDLVTTALIGKDPDVHLADFVLDEKNHQMLSCPMGCVPLKTYHQKRDCYRVLFRKEDCGNCPHREACRMKEQKNSFYILITPLMISRAKYLRKISTDEYRKLAKKRNAVEGIPSVLRRKYHVDQIPVRGYVRSKLWYTLKIGAINAKRVIDKVLSPLFFALFSPKKLFFPLICRKKQMTEKKLQLQAA